MMSKHTGTNFDDFLEEEGILEEVTLNAQKRLLSLQIMDVMEESGLSKAEIARRMGTSRSQIDRLLDPDTTTITLDSLARLAKAIGKQLKIEFA